MKKAVKFHFHPTQGADGDGNYRPLVTDPGWITFDVPNAKDAWDDDAALEALPPEHQAKVRKCMKKYKCKSLSQLISDTCLWGVDFSIAGEGSDGEDGQWEYFVDEDSGFVPR